MNRGIVKLENPKRFKKDFSVGEDKLSDAIAAAASKLKSKIDVYMDEFPCPTKEGYRYKNDNANYI